MHPLRGHAAPRAHAAPGLGEVDRGAVDWAGLRIGGATWADLDPLEFERIRRLTATAGDRADRLLASLSDREIASALDAPAGYVRVHGFEPLQQEQTVLQYVDAHGQITRTEAADLCSLTPDQASRLLRRLAKEGKLKLRGERRGSEYVRPAR